ncbi:hypothetical protein [Halorubrum sp. C191]|uniref:hypothetical protein n=1 Tax=Halorubrum sp. C191 TaxID=1383842 RepID=UPI001181B055|nr:hypothetical protein [Halorubrum sp. C191]
MRRRKLLIGIGAAAAGGSAAFGTEAFTSVQAERNVDVSVAGDQSSFIAIKGTGSDNAAKYVTADGNSNVVEINLDGDNTGSGSGVPDNAITKLDNLLTVINQGSQSVDVYFEDDSDAVTFRLDDGNAEGVGNAKTLEVGESATVGITVDTTGSAGGVGTDLLDNVTLVAESETGATTAPEQINGQTIYVGAQTDFPESEPGDSSDFFTDIQSALDEVRNPDTGRDEPIGRIQVSASASGGPFGPVEVDEPVVIEGVGGQPQITGSTDPIGSDPAAAFLNADGAQIRGFDVSSSSNNAVSVGRNVANAVVADSTLSGASGANDVFVFEGTDNIEIRNNTINSSDVQQSIYAQGETSVGTASTRVKILDNEFTGSVTSGGQVIGFEADDGRIAGNVFETSNISYSAIEIFGDGIEFLDNELRVSSPGNSNHQDLVLAKPGVNSNVGVANAVIRNNVIVDSLPSNGSVIDISGAAETLTIENNDIEGDPISTSGGKAVAGPLTVNIKDNKIDLRGSASNQNGIWWKPYNQSSYDPSGNVYDITGNEINGNNTTKPDIKVNADPGGSTFNYEVNGVNGGGTGTASEAAERLLEDNTVNLVKVEDKTETQ